MPTSLSETVRYGVVISLYLLTTPAIAAEPSSDWDRFVEPGELEALARLSKSDHAKAAFTALQTGAGATDPEQTLWYQATHKSLENMLQSLIER